MDIGHPSYMQIFQMPPQMTRIRPFLFPSTSYTMILSTFTVMHAIPSEQSETHNQVILCHKHLMTAKHSKKVKNIDSYKIEKRHCQ